MISVGRMVRRVGFFDRPDQQVYSFKIFFKNKVI